MKIMLIDDHALFREGIAMLLTGVDGALSAEQFDSYDLALGWLASGNAADLALVDLELPGVSGMDGLDRLHRVAPGLAIVVLSAHDDRTTVLKAIDRGALGFIPKSSSSAEMFLALRTVSAGGIYLPAAIVHGDSSAPRPETSLEARWTSDSGSTKTLGITPRQQDVLRLILLGKSAKVIARELDIGASTVKTHTGAVLRALNVTTRTQAVIAAARAGLRIK